MNDILICKEAMTYIYKYMLYWEEIDKAILLGCDIPRVRDFLRQNNIVPHYEYFKGDFKFGDCWISLKEMNLVRNILLDRILTMGKTFDVIDIECSEKEIKQEQLEF